MVVKLFGKEIILRDKYCQFFGKEGSDITSPYLNIYVKFKGCNADCLFCEYKSDAKPFNFKKYEDILDEIEKQNIELRKLALSGGEPTLNYKLFNEVLNYTRNRLPNNYISMNTNGVNLKRMFDEGVFDKLDDISLSRHHYDEVENNKTLAFDSISNEEIKAIQDVYPRRDLIQFSCNLIKGGIDTHDKAIEFLENATKLGINNVGFVDLMPINQYCKDNFVGNKTLGLHNDEENFFNSKKFECVGYCKCANYLYTPKDFKGEFLKMYMKNTFNNQETTNTLTFDGENLRYGFGGDIIY